MAEMEISKFLKEEKCSCKDLEKRILKEAPSAVPQGKKHRVELEEDKNSGDNPHISAKILWLEKRGGVELTGQIPGTAAYSAPSALMNLKVKIDDMARKQK